MDTSENHNTHQKAGTLKEELKGILIIGTLILIFLSLIVKKYDNKKYLIFFCVFTPRIIPDARLGLWTLRPRFLRGLSPRSIFQTAQRFLLPNHVTSGSMSPRSFFHTGQRFLLPNHVTSGCLSLRSIFSHWSAVLSPPSP